MIGYANDPRNELKRSGGQLDSEFFFLFFFFFVSLIILYTRIIDLNRTMTFTFDESIVSDF